METEQKPVMIVGFDHSYYALQWTLDHLLAPKSPFKLVVVHSKPSPTSAIGLGSRSFSMQVDDAIVEVVEGDPRNVLCEAVERHHAGTVEPL
ncbi:hypothetical protein L1987_60524 [Smallanthus sonchifolius]|uniref:Uncharacterized protein n=1 Tax=Smallanthus sonchifolius TaxID=185202 RepID=A0ACB9D8Q0_9ASTR|nr:hypothetical protein L1987_60524 [Smallanthus sonchifolius]